MVIDRSALELSGQKEKKERVHSHFLLEKLHEFYLKTVHNKNSEKLSLVLTAHHSLYQLSLYIMFH